MIADDPPPSLSKCADEKEQKFTERVNRIGGAVREALRDDTPATWQELMRATFGFAADCAVAGCLGKRAFMKDAEIAYDWFVRGKQ